MKMNFKKSTMILGSAFAFALTLGACSSKKAEETDETAVQSTEMAPTEPAPVEQVDLGAASSGRAH